MGFFPDSSRLPSSPYKAYLEESRTPLVCLLFTLPFFISYHLGVYLIGQIDQKGYANGADVALSVALNYLGIGGPLISFFFVVVVFVFLQQYSGRPFRARAGTLALMVLESMLFALPLFALGSILTWVIDPHWVQAGLLAASDFPGGESSYRFAVNMVLAVGAGVYEEFLFRMLMYAALLGFFRHVCRLKKTTPYILAVLVQAVLFALFHHMPGTQDALSLEYIQTMEFMRAFAFRTVAGVYFAYLYMDRGFGIAAGSHAFYDIFAVTLNAFR